MFVKLFSACFLVYFLSCDSEATEASNGSRRPCPKNEEFSDCANLPPKCQHLCPNAPPTGIRCIELCQKGCVCKKPGFVRDPSKDYKCVPEAKCERKGLLVICPTMPCILFTVR